MDMRKGSKLKSKGRNGGLAWDGRIQSGMISGEGAGKSLSGADIVARMLWDMELILQRRFCLMHTSCTGCFVCVTEA